MSQKNIYFVTCGDTNSGPNPGMTERGLAAVRAHRHLLPAEPSCAICGTGRRHRETAEVLGLPPPAYSFLVGIAEYYESTKDGQKLILADGTEVICQPNDLGSDIWHDLNLRNLDKVVRYFIQYLLHDTVVCCDQQRLDILWRATRSDFARKPATVYLLTMDNGGRIDIRELKSGQSATA